MFEGLLACWRGMRHLEHRGYIYIWANLLWVALSLPLITAPAAWAGLVALSRAAYNGPSANINDFWDGFWANLKRGVFAGLLNVGVIGVSLGNLHFYREQSGVLFDVLRVVWVGVLLVWLTLQFYMWPLLYEMKTPTLKGALRNAAVMILLNPLFTFGLMLGVALVIVFSTVLMALWIVLTGGLLAAIATGAVLDRLETAGLRGGS